MSEDRVQVVRGSAEPVPLPLIASGGEALAVVWPGVGSQHRSLHRLLLEPGGRTIDLQHPSESVYYVRAGSVTVTDGDDGAQHALVEGSMVHVDPSRRIDSKRARMARRSWAARALPTPPSTSHGRSDMAVRVFHRDEPI